jgi:hypothetical protein
VSSRRSLLFAAPAVVVAAAIGYSLFFHQVPAGQPPLADMNLAAFRENFNRAANQTRLIVLLSPT